jgi:sRNA-binding regulator protein Hfq
MSNGGAMKDAIDALPVARPLEQEGFANRKLIRPSLSRAEHNHTQLSISDRRDRPERVERTDRNDRDRNDRDRNDRGGGGSSGPGRKTSPPEQTNAENFYYQKQMQSRTPMVVVLKDGEEIHGVIEWYDKSCIKVNRNGQPNLMIYKPSIKYMYKEAERKG